MPGPAALSAPSASIKASTLLSGTCVGGDRIGDREAQSDFGHKHAMLSAAFAEEFLPDPWRSSVKKLAGNHHRPRPHSVEELLVSLADMLSARERNDGTEDDNPRRQHPKQLFSIFSVLKADGIKPSEAERRFLPMRSLSLQPETLFPCQPSVRRERILVRGLKPLCVRGKQRLTHAPDAWYVPGSVKVGYGISFTRYFYRPQPLRPPEEIRADIRALEQEAEGLLEEIRGGAA